MEESKKLYISIPITGFDLKKQTDKADRLKARLSRKGWRVVTPFEIYAGKNPDYFDYIAADLRTLMDCDAVYFCEGWEHSCGCGIEHDTVMRLKAYGKKEIYVMYEI